MKTTKFVSLMLAMLMFAFVFASCDGGDDEREVSGLNDFYIEVKVSGGGLSAAELNALEASLNSEGLYIWEEKKEEAIKIFDDFIEEITYEYYDGLSWVEGTLEMKFTLKTTKGVKIKSSSVYVTDKESWNKAPESRCVTESEFVSEKDM